MVKLGLRVAFDLAEAHLAGAAGPALRKKEVGGVATVTEWSVSLEQAVRP